MRLPRWLVPAGLVLASVGIAVALAVNARGGPRRETTLTEREVRLLEADDEDTALWMSLEWVEPGDSSRGGWVGMARLAALGLDTTLLEGGARTRERTAPAYAVLELDGPSRQAWIAERMAEQGRQVDGTLATRDSILGRYRRSLENRTRLVLVDVGPDAAALAARYPDASRHLIVRATVQTFVNWRPRAPAAPSVQDTVLGSRVVLERPRMLLSGPRAAAFRAARRPTAYDVTVATGRGFVPWIADARPREEPEPVHDTSAAVLPRPEPEGDPLITPGAFCEVAQTPSEAPLLAAPTDATPLLPADTAICTR
jgi:hypothetical protein